MSSASVAPVVPIVDAHLDLAWNARKGRDLTLTAAELRAVEQRTSEQAMATLPELRRGGVAVAFGTLYVGTHDGVYTTPPDEDARQQLGIYRGWADEGLIRLVTDRASLDAHLEAWSSDGVLGVVVLIEGADSILTPDHLGEWFDAGVRVIGPAWSRTRYCGGTRAPGGLTDLGRELLDAMKECGVILDVSHMAEESFWDAMSQGFHRVIATHANARALVDPEIADRHLSDEMIRALGEADGVIGVVPANVFLEPGRMTPDPSAPPVTLDAVKRHMHHIASLIGWERVAIGSDLDGGFGKEESPVELDTVADLRRIAELVPPGSSEGVLGGNWLRVLGASLP